MAVGVHGQPVHDSVSVGPASTQILAYNPKREHASIYNPGTSPIYVAFGVAAQVGKGWVIPPLGGMTLSQVDRDDFWVGDVVNGITDGDTIVVATAEVSR